MSRSLRLVPALALVLAACSDDPTAVHPTGPSQSTATAAAAAPKLWQTNAAVTWNEKARGLVAANRSNPFVAIRGYAVVSVAQYNAAIAAERTTGQGRPSIHAAVAAASVVALTYLYPGESSNLEALLDQALAGAPWPGESQADVDAGEAIGRTVGAAVVARAQTDNFFAPWTGTVPTGPGVWSSATPPVGAGFGQAKTWFLLSSSQFRPQPHPAYGSPAFQADLAEVRRISDTRTAQQNDLANFWNLPAGTHTPPGYWNEEASRLAVQYRLNLRRTTHLLALMNMVSFDAVVASHEAKYHYWLLRPSQADPAITTSFTLPNFPSYPSNHAAISAGMARIIGNVFPAERSRLDGLANEAALSRIYGGIHYRFDGDAGLELGRKVAAWALLRDVDGPEPFPLD